MTENIEKEQIDQNRRKFLTGTTAVIGVTGVGFAAVPFIGSWQPSDRAKAMGAPVQVDISRVAPGALIVVEWRGQPVYILRRTQETLADIVKARPLVSDPDSLEADQPDFIQGDARTIAGKEELLVMVGICTHLGCAPKFRPTVGDKEMGGNTWFGGFFCPCHGSKFDLSGRVYKGAPAPSNLKVPPYRYDSDKLITIGEV